MSSSAKDGKPIDTTTDYESIKIDTHEGDAAANTAMMENVSKDTDTQSATSQTSTKVSKVDAYTLLKDGSQPFTLGDFSVIKKIGQGGMGAVFKARQISLDREVALKVLARHLADDEKFVSRFNREARVMARLDHGNIIRCYQVGKENGLDYLAMEYVDGCSLQDLIDKHGRFSVGDALYVTLRVADALQYAHELNLVHRDIKPDNILITKKGVVKVADLGLAKPVNDDLSMTAAGVGAGTPHYMAPEQMRSAKEVDGRADIYALGGMLYVMLTGKKPHDGATLIKLLEQKEKGRVEPASKLNSSVPEILDQMIEKMLTKNITARYQTCVEVMHDLDSLGLASDYLTLLFPDGPPTGYVAKSNFSGRSSIGAPPATSSTSTRIPPRESDSGVAEVWYVAAGTTAEGKKKVRKLTQNQMMELIRSKQLHSTDEASRQAGTGYRALSTFKEFEALFRAQIARHKLKTKAKNLQSTDEADSNQQGKWWGPLMQGTGVWAVLFVGLVILISVALALWYFL